MSAGFVIEGLDAGEAIPIQFVAGHEAFEPRLTILNETTGNVVSEISEHDAGNLITELVTEENNRYRVQLHAPDDSQDYVFRFNIPPVESDVFFNEPQNFIQVGETLTGSIITGDFAIAFYDLIGVEPGDQLRITLTTPEEDSLWSPELTLTDDLSDDIFGFIGREEGRLPLEIIHTFESQSNYSITILDDRIGDEEEKEFTLSVERL